METFKSHFAEQLKAFLAYKREFGHPYNKQGYYLMDFDRFCSEFYPEENVLTSKLCLDWASIRLCENSNGYISRITPLRQFGKYQRQMGLEAFVLPEDLKGKSMPVLSYVFSPKSLMQFFHFTDYMEPYYQSTLRHLVAPVMFRYMYSCGLRPQEARNLHKEDIDLKSGRIFIRESKENRERIIMASPDLMQLTEIYLEKLRFHCPYSQALFPDRKGRFLSYDTQKYLFYHCREGSGISADGTKEPNLYSFRHTFATFRIYKWLNDGYDIREYLPYLSAYMGHKNYSSTAYYIHLVPAVFPRMSGIDLNSFSDLIPEVSQDE